MNSADTQKTRDLLLERGSEIVRQSGLRSLTVRGLCQEAGVNPGSFVYHFGSRDKFLAELIELWYAPLFEQIQTEFEQTGTPLERLRKMMRQLVFYIGGRGAVIAQVVMDGFAGEPVVVEFLRGLGMWHPQFLLRCIQEAQDAGELVRDDPRHVFMFLMASVGLPMIVHGMTNGKTVLPDLIQETLSQFAADPQHIEQRLEWALRGLRVVESSK